MQERIERTDPPDEPAARLPENARDGLRRRLEQIADGHPSSNDYGDARPSRPDGGRDASRADTIRENVTAADTSSRVASQADSGGQEQAGTRRYGNLDAAERAKSSSEAPEARGQADRPAEDDIHLTPDRRRHILDGDGEGKPGGGHRHGTNKPGKTEFPERWSDDVITQTVEDVARRPDSAERQRDGSWLVAGKRDGVQVNTVVQADGRIWTAWPEPGGDGVRQNQREGVT